MDKACLNCAQPRGRNGGRGLCDACYRRNERAGTLDRWRKINVPRDVVVENIEAMAGERWESVAARLGMSRPAIRAALRRAGRHDLIRGLSSL